MALTRRIKSKSDRLTIPKSSRDEVAPPSLLSSSRYKSHPIAIHQNSNQKLVTRTQTPTPNPPPRFWCTEHGDSHGSPGARARVKANEPVGSRSEDDGTVRGRLELCDPITEQKLGIGSVWSRANAEGANRISRAVHYRLGFCASPFVAYDLLSPR